MGRGRRSKVVLSCKFSRCLGMDSLRLCLSCAGRKPAGSRNKGSRRNSGAGCFSKGGSSKGCRPADLPLADGPQLPASPHHRLSSIEERDVAASSSSVSDDSLEKILEHAAHDDQPDTPGYWRNRGIGDVDTPPIRRRGLLIPPPPLSCYSSSSNSVTFSVDSCTNFVVQILFFILLFFIFLIEKKMKFDF